MVLYFDADLDIPLLLFLRTLFSAAALYVVASACSRYALVGHIHLQVFLFPKYFLHYLSFAIFGQVVCPLWLL